MKRLNAQPDTVNREQLLFGINQGAIYEDIRIGHAKTISKMELDGYAVGGLAVGETHEEMYRILDAVVPHLPAVSYTHLDVYKRQDTPGGVFRPGETLALGRRGR